MERTRTTKLSKLKAGRPSPARQSPDRGTRSNRSRPYPNPRRRTPQRGQRISTTHVPTNIHTPTTHTRPFTPQRNTPQCNTPLLPSPAPLLPSPTPAPTNMPHNYSYLQATPTSPYTPYHPYPAPPSFYVPQAQPVFSPYGHPSYGQMMTVGQGTSAMEPPISADQVKGIVKEAVSHLVTNTEHTQCKETQCKLVSHGQDKSKHHTM